MTKLMSVVKAHTTSQETNGKKTLELFVTCVDHMFGESGDWSPLAWLIAKSQPKQQHILRRLAGLTLQGFTLVKCDKTPMGLRIKAIKDENQGIDDLFLSKVRELVSAGVTIQSEKVSALWAVDRSEEEFDPISWAAKIAKSKKYQGQLDAMIAALQAQRKAA